MNFIKTKAPFILGLILSVLGVLETFDWTTLLGHNTPLAGAITTGIGGLIMILRPIVKLLEISKIKK